MSYVVLPTEFPNLRMEAQDNLPYGNILGTI